MVWNMHTRYPAMHCSIPYIKKKYIWFSVKNNQDTLFFKGGVKAENFNDDALGRCLDAVYEYGVTKFFSEIAFEIGIEQKLLGKTFNIDTTSLVVHGDYEQFETEESKKVDSDSTLSDPSQGAIPKHGYSKEHRHDLKQMVLNLATTGKAGFPIWMESHSGNASDKKILQEAAKRMQTLCKGLKEAPSFMIVGDSAIYDACLKEAGDMLWLTRVPERHKAAKKLLQYSDDAYGWSKLMGQYETELLGNELIPCTNL